MENTPMILRSAAKCVSESSLRLPVYEFLGQFEIDFSFAEIHFAICRVRHTCILQNEDTSLPRRRETYISDVQRQKGVR